jgi:hypothetical protein
VNCPHGIDRSQYECGSCNIADDATKRPNCPHGATARDPTGCGLDVTDAPPPPPPPPQERDPRAERVMLCESAAHRLAYDLATCEHTNRSIWYGGPRQERLDLCADCGARSRDLGGWTFPTLVQVAKNLDRDGRSSGHTKSGASGDSETKNDKPTNPRT